MKTLIRLSPGLLLLAVVAAGCSRIASPFDEPVAVETKPAAAEVKKSPFGRNLYFETKGNKRYVIISAAVAHQEQQFCEFFLCRTNTKEYESVLVADIEPIKIHQTMIAPGANACSPVQY